MKVPLRYAVMSFCPDLTDPQAVARPVAIVGAGRLYLPRGRKSDFAFYVVRNRPGSDPALPQDELSQSILNGLPVLFDKQIFDGVSGVALDRFLPWLQNRFRNSLHVASVHETTVPARDQVELQSSCVRLYLKTVLRLPSGRLKLPGREDRRSPPATPQPELMPFEFEDGYAYKVQPFEARALQAVG
jgi:hypothetical protein